MFRYTNYILVYVYTSIYKYILVYTYTHFFTTTIHLESSSILLAASTSLLSTLVPCIAGSFISPCCLLDIQSTQAWLAAPKLPQPRVDLIHIAVAPAINRLRVGTAHQKA